MDEPIRVAYTLEQCWHKVPGGTAVAALETARALADRKEVRLVGVAARHAGPPMAAWTPPIEVHHLPLPRLALYESWHRLRRPRVERATGPVDVVHATTLAMPPRSKPIVLTIHDLAFLHHPQHFTARGLSFFGRGLRIALRDADLVLCSSRAVLGDCRAAGFAEERLRLVPLGVVSRLASREEVERVRRRYRLERPYVMWAGTIEPRKNLPGLITAFRNLERDLDLVLAGPDGWNEDLGTLVAPIRDRVRLVGFVPATDRDALLAGAEVFCYPSLMEGFGLPVLEAMAQGTPVVTSAGTSTEEVAEGAGVIVDPHDPDAIAAGLRSVVDDPATAAGLMQKGLARAAEYTWERTAQLVSACYAEVRGRA
ncbi:MAG TPA: glycosyltransferase family 1 protein [Actinomycetota bacterium]|nr:glycosyltransferase family 1 protein [Actinomycetota bacterium]